MKNKNHTQAVIIESNGLLRITVAITERGVFCPRHYETYAFNNGIKRFSYSFAGTIEMKNKKGMTRYPIYQAS